MCCQKVIVLFVAFCGQFFFSQLGCYVSAVVRKTAVPIARTLKIDAIDQKQVSLMQYSKEKTMFRRSAVFNR